MTCFLLFVTIKFKKSVLCGLEIKDTYYHDIILSEYFKSICGKSGIEKCLFSYRGSWKSCHCGHQRCRKNNAAPHHRRRNDSRWRTGGSGERQDTWVSRPEQHRGHLSHHLRGTVIRQGGSAAPGRKDPGMRKQYEACWWGCSGRPDEAVHLSHPRFRDRRRLSLPQWAGRCFKGSWLYRRWILQAGCHTLRRSKDPCGVRTASVTESGSDHLRWANEPSGYEFHRLVRDLSVELQGSRSHRLPRPIFSGPDRRKSHWDRSVQGYDLYGQLFRLCHKKGTAARRCLECLYEPAAWDQASGRSYRKIKVLQPGKVHQAGGKPGENVGQDRGHRKALRGPHGYEADADAPDLKRKWCADCRASVQKLWLP